MELKDIKELIQTINDSQLAYFELKFEDSYVKMDKSFSRGTVENKSNECSSSNGEINSVNKLSNNNVNIDNNETVDYSKENNEVNDDNFEFINCPMVGTYYGSSAPGKDSFISKGDIVKKGSVLCIVEAMKLMNEIEAEFDMEIVDILVKDGEMVEYGKPILKVRRG